MIIGAPGYAETRQFEIQAEAPASGATSDVSLESLRTMMKALMTERFGLAVHTENRPVDTFVLTSVKPMS